MTPILALPAELLIKIAEATLPYDFESLALTSKRFHNILQNLILRHNQYRSRFRNFAYDKRRDVAHSTSIRTAWELIVTIAKDPIIAQYIVHANFRNDSVYVDDSDKLLDAYDDVHAIRLIESSPHLQQASFSSDLFLELIQNQLRTQRARFRYSDAAAIFVLSLLPNVESLILPAEWQQGLSGDPEEIKLVELGQLLSLVSSNCKQQTSTDSAPPLRKVTEVTLSCDWVARTWPRSWSAAAESLMPLPSLRTLRVLESVDLAWGVTSKEFSGADTLEALFLENCFLPSRALSQTLDFCSNLRTLSYRSSIKRWQQAARWNPFEFLNIIGQKVGSHLEVLSISAQYHQCRIGFEDVAMNRFKRLRRFEFGLELVVFACARRQRSVSQSEHKTDAQGPRTTLMSLDQSILEAMVPESVNELSIFAREFIPGETRGLRNAEFAAALADLFKTFAADQAKILPNLTIIFLDCAQDASDDYKAQCQTVMAEVSRTDVALHLRTPAEFLLEPLDLTVYTEEQYEHQASVRFREEE